VTTAGVVYIVDDDELVLKAAGRLVRSAGSHAKTYSKPEIFLSEFDAEADACIVLGITMPGMTGLQVQAELNARGTEAPVIILSSRDDEATRLHARTLGARCFLCKPIDEEALLAAIASALQVG
jgi:FixJ family two-component response regulator